MDCNEAPNLEETERNEETSSTKGLAGSPVDENRELDEHLIGNEINELTENENFVHDFNGATAAGDGEDMEEHHNNSAHSGGSELESQSPEIDSDDSGTVVLKQKPLLSKAKRDERPVFERENSSGRMRKFVLVKLGLTKTTNDLPRFENGESVESLIAKIDLIKSRRRGVEVTTLARLKQDIPEVRPLPGSKSRNNKRIVVEGAQEIKHEYNYKPSFLSRSLFMLNK